MSESAKRQVTRVLLVEDDADYAYLVRRVLKQGGSGRFELERVDYLAKALEKLSVGEVDIVLLDLGLPDGFGLDTFHQLHRHAPDVPVVVLSGLDDDTVAVQAVGEGAQDYIFKGDLGGPVLVRAIRYAIERQRLQSTLRHLTLEDDLTGLYNRRGFFTLAEPQLKLAVRQRRPLVVAFADLDGLKAINDRHGHDAGSRALIEVAEVLRGTFRDSDILARLGGDEFVVLLIETDAEGFREPARRLQQRLEALNVRGHRRYQLSLSVGAAAFDPASPCPLQELVDRADQAMYAEKRRRNRGRSNRSQSSEPPG